MIVSDLHITDFRNLAEVSLTLDPRFNVIVGANGQGKTNLVEAVNLLATLRSFRSFRNRDLIRQDADVARVTAMVDRAGVRREVGVTVRPSGKRVELNGKGVRDLSAFFGEVNTVVFAPEDIGVLRGSPTDRRLLLDRIIFNAQPSYAAMVSDYEQVVKQRNALLKHDRPDPALVAIYDEQLVTLGVQVIQRRRAWLSEMHAPFVQAFAEIFDDALDVALTYEIRFLRERDDVDPDDAGALAEAMRGALSRRWVVDVARGYTTVGPHRDDLVATLQGQPIKTWASQGQHRAFILALKITEIRLLRQRLGAPPVLLLDDVSSELDPARNEKLFAFLSEVDGQVLITTTDASYLRLEHPYTRWNVSEGRVEHG